MYPSSYKKGNWGRWGDDDERGALNLITPEVVLKAARLVRKGRVHTLGFPIRNNHEGIPSFPGRTAPVHGALITRNGAKGHGGGDDYLILNTHNAPSHIDALGHFWYADRMYNNHSPDEASTAGTKRCGVDKIGAIVTRGVLLDFPRFQGVHNLKQGEVISGEDMLKCAERQGVKFETGDAILVRTNYPSQFDPERPDEYFKGCPGIGLSSVGLFDQYGIVAIGSDTSYVEVNPPEVKDAGVPLHEELLWSRGVYFLEALDLESLAAEQVYEFLLVVNPLKLDKGMGSPINPVAIF